MTLNRKMLEENEMDGYAGYAKVEEYNAGLTRRIAEKYRTAAERLWPQLEAKFTRASQPLSGRALEAATSAIGLACELSVAYKRLLAHHLCDWLVPTTDLLNDRGMMGDGVIDLPQIRQWMEAAGYRGFHEVEIFSTRWWKADPDVVLDTCIRRYRDVT